TRVFSYRAVVLEVATGRRPIEKEGKSSKKSGKVGTGSGRVLVWASRLQERLLKVNLKSGRSQDFQLGEADSA
ncbi:hypothetical protein Tco_0472833, partial [Tanacetum coccineum]